MSGFMDAQQFTPVSNNNSNSNNNYQSFMQGMPEGIFGYNALLPQLTPSFNNNIDFGLGTSLPTSGLGSYGLNNSGLNINGAGLAGSVFDLNPTQLNGLNTAGAAAATGPSFAQSMMGWKDPKTGNTHGGWGPVALNLASSAGSMYLGLKNLGVAKDTLKFQKNAFSKQFDAQRQTINTHLADRQRARLSAASGDTSHTLSVEDYMRQNAV